MTAKEMFKKLGFKQYKNKWDKKYEKQYKVPMIIRYFNKKLRWEVDFDLLDCDFSAYHRGFSTTIGIDIELLQAINKQVEELGWNE